MRLDGACAHLQTLTDILVGPPLTHEFQNGFFSLRQIVSGYGGMAGEITRMRMRNG